MTQHKKKDDETNSIYTTNIGSVAGQVHTGSGDIIVKSFSIGDSISTKDEFVAALNQFIEVLETARKNGLSEDVADDTIIEINAAKRETNKEEPKTDRILQRLKQAQNILIASTGIATATKAAVDAANKLLPFLENAIQIVNRIF